MSELKDGSTVLEGYSYLGLGTVVVRSHPQSGVDLSYVKLSGESVGDAGDQYTGLDRFGRIYDQRWITAANGVSVDRYQYAYDRNSNRTSRTNVLNTNLNESYGYDNLNQLTSSSVTGMSKSWDYDALGNWDGVTTNGATQTRTHNKQNEITAMSGATTPVFDAAGNMTTDETGKQYVYDAWNRLVTVKNSGGTTIASYAYDPLTRRVSETASSVTTDLYYSAAWQVLEERVSGNAVKSYVWSPVYVDAMVARDRDTDANGSFDERLYVTHDANFNVTGLVNTSGTVVERFTYDPYGMATVRGGSWSTTTDAYVWQYLHQGGRLSGQSGLYSFRHREYSPTLGRWVTLDPIAFISNTNNLYSYIHNNSINFFDPVGLKEIPANSHDSLSVLRFWLQAIAKSDSCKEEAKRIAAAINNTYNYNGMPGLTGALSSIGIQRNDERNKCKYCYEWAYGFEDAFNLESSGKCFKVTVEGARKPGSEDKEGNYRSHFWIVVESLETGEKVYIDDGFAVAGGYIHSSRPIPKGWVYEPGAIADQTRKTCSPVTPFNSRGWRDGVEPPKNPGFPRPASGGAW